MRTTETPSLLHRAGGHTLVLGLGVSGNTGAYDLEGGELIAAGMSVDVGASFVHAGGVCEPGTLNVAGSYALSGAGRLNAQSISIATNGRFTQAGGINTSGTLVVGGSATLGTYTLSGDAQMTIASGIVAWNGKGLFTQTGGAANWGSLYVGLSGVGTVDLRGGAMSARRTFVGMETPGQPVTATLTQSGGTAAYDYLSVRATGQYLLSAGTMSLSQGLKVRGKLDLGGQPAAWDLDNFIFDAAGGQILNAGTASLSLGPNTMTILAPGQNLGAIFGSYANSGLVFTSSTTMTIPAGRSISAAAELDDKVSVAGSLTAAPGARIDLRNGLYVAGGQVDLGPGTLTVKDAASGMTSGTVRAPLFVGGNGGNGTFTQSGGQASFDTMILGQGGNSGTYVQSGGTVTTGTLYLTHDINSAGVYRISGGSLIVDSLWLDAIHDPPAGALYITNSAANVTVRKYMNIGSSGVLSAVPGSVMHFTGSGNFDTGSSIYDYPGFAGFANLALRFEGGPGQIANLALGRAVGQWGLNALEAGGVQEGHAHVAQSMAPSFTVGRVLIGAGSSLVIDSLIMNVTGSFTNNGRYISAVSSTYLTNAYVGASGSIEAASGDQMFVKGSFRNASAQGTAWSTSAARLIFQGGGSHTLQVAGSNTGPLRTAYADNFAWGTLSLAAGNSLVLQDGNSTPGGAMYVGVLDLAGGLAQIGAITGNGMDIIYDPKLPANAYLGGHAYGLAGGGVISPIVGMGDANRDGIVDMMEYLTWFNNYGRTGVGWDQADFNLDGITDMTDYITWFNYFGQEGEGGPVPEPATTCLLAFGLPLVRRNRR